MKVKAEKSPSKSYRIFGNRFTKEEYITIITGLKKAKGKKETNTDVLIRMLKKETKDILKNKIYTSKTRIYFLEKDEIEKILKLYFERKEELLCFSKIIPKKRGLINLELIDNFGKKYGIAIFDKKKKNFDKKLSNHLKKMQIFLWDPENLCKIKGIQRIEVEDVYSFAKKYYS